MTAGKKGACLLCMTCVLALTVGLIARQAPPGPPGLKTGNPTPGTPQPDPPNLADRITLTGCVQPADNAGAPGAAKNPNNPSDSRFVLMKAERRNVVPPGTGTSEIAAGATGAIWRLQGIDSQLSAFVGTKVEVSGEVLPSTGDAAKAPTLQVEFVQKLSQTCS